MQYGKTEAETLHLNGWGPGDILSGDEGRGPEEILITQVGEERFLCRWKHLGQTEFGHEPGNTTLRCRAWEKVGHREAPPSTDTSDKQHSMLRRDIALDIAESLRDAAARHHLDKSPSAAAAVSFLLSLARQEAEKHKPLNLSPTSK